MILLKTKIYGQVQGVFFRSEAKRKANELDLAGFARNEADGTVYIEAQGAKEKVDDFLHWLKHQGPPLARVERIESKLSLDLKNYKTFSIK